MIKHFRAFPLLSISLLFVCISSSGCSRGGRTSSPSATSDSARLKDPPSANPSAIPRIPPVSEVALESPPEACRLERWEDGDTAYVDCPTGKTPVRLLGIDTPESGFDHNSNRRGHYQTDLWHIPFDEVLECGRAATRRAKELCPEGSPVDIVGTKLDKYKRRLGYVVCQGIDINTRLVAEGHAGRYPYPAPPEKPSGCPRK